VDCLAGGVIAALLFLAVLPGLVEVTRPLDSLAPTVLLFVLLFAWFVLWALVGAVRERALVATE
jgi:threonine/homoserine/homoserine lactone efflux protein